MVDEATTDPAHLNLTSIQDFAAAFAENRKTPSTSESHIISSRVTSRHQNVIRSSDRR